MRSSLSVGRSLILFAFASFGLAQLNNCTKANTSYCEDPVYGATSNYVIFRCEKGSGQPVLGNCNQDLMNVAPKGYKNTYCWESSPTAGDAQCTFNCVAVNGTNGTSFYPVGCVSSSSSSMLMSMSKNASATSMVGSKTSAGVVPTGSSAGPSSGTATGAQATSSSTGAANVYGSDMWAIAGAIVGGQWMGMLLA